MKSQEIGGKDITWYYTEYNYTDYMSIPAQTWIHEHTSPNMSTWAYQPKHEYMSIPAQTWVHEQKIPAQTWVHEHTSPNIITWAYQPKHEYMSIRMGIQLYVGILAQYGYTNPCMWAHWPSFICGHTGPTTECNYTDYMSTWAYGWEYNYMWAY